MEREMTPRKHVLKFLSDGGGWYPEEKTGYRVLGNAWMEGAAGGSEVRRGSRRGDAAKTQKVKWDSREKSWGRAFQQDEPPGQGPWVGMNLGVCATARRSESPGGGVDRPPLDPRACTSGSISVAPSIFSGQGTLPRAAGRAHCVKGSE